VASPLDVGISRSQRAREELAKAWLLDLLERTPLEEIERVPIGWIAAEGPALIADIVRSLADPSPGGESALPLDGLDRVSELGGLRDGEAAREIPRDLAALQALLIEALRAETPDRHVGAFAGSVGRLASIFGDIQAHVSDELVHQRSGGAKVDPVTGLPGQAELHEWLRILLGEYRRHGEPFCLLFVDIEGLGRIIEAYGRKGGDRMIRAVTALVKRDLRPADRAFRLADEELCVLAPGQTVEQARIVAEQLSDVVAKCSAPDGSRLAVSVGLAGCPEHGTDEESLMAAAEEGSWAAKAAGRPVGVPGQV
jgi:diguanylate cyclase (GGDEF)-like protein